MEVEDDVEDSVLIVPYESFVAVAFTVPVLDMVIVPAVSVAVPIGIRLLSFSSFVVAAHFLDVVAPDIVVLFELVLY